MSTCLPPLFRPPNRPPDLQTMINDALHVAAGPKAPSSLLEYHINALNEGDDNRMELPSANQAMQVDQPTKKGKGKAAVGLRKVASVKPSEERGEDWDQEVESRLTEMFGQRSRRRLSSQGPVLPQQAALSPVSSPMLPSTQPMGASLLARSYSRDGRSISSATSDDGMSEDEENIHPMPRSSQDQQVAAADEDDEIDSTPFRRRGGSRADGDLPGKRHTAGDEGRYGKRIRGERGVAGGLR